MSCGPPLTLMKRTTLPALTVSAAGSKAALLVPSPVIFTSTTAVGVAVAAAGAGAAFAVATAAVCEASPFFSPPQAATPNTASVLSTVQRIADLLRSRSEEHTSELQSLAYLVCRLLLEKKKKKYNKSNSDYEY